MKENFKIKLFLIGLIIFLGRDIFACSVIVGKDSNQVLVGFNEDYFYENPFIWFTQKTKKHYSCAFFGYSYVNDFGRIKMRIPGKAAPQQGINEKGLFFDNLATPSHEIDKNPEMKSTSYQGIKEMMKTCATVDESMVYLKKHHLTYFKTAKIFLSDSTGKYLIYDGKNFIQSGEVNFCVTTNFLENEKDLGDFPCLRYTRANELFELNSEITVNNFNSILKAVKQSDENLMGGTFYSGIFNPKTGNINLHYVQDFENKYVMNIYDEMANGTKKIYLKNLFLKRSSTEIAKTLSRKGSIDAMNQFYKNLENPIYNNSESELVFTSKAFFNTGHYKESDEIIKLALKNYPNSEFVKQQSLRIDLMTSNIEEYINYYISKGELDSEFGNLIITNNFIGANKLLVSTKNKNKLFKEATLNTIGYRFINTGKVEIAISLFKLNVVAYPNSDNTYDSLAEAYMINGEVGLAKENYTKSLELNPNNNNAKEMLKKLK